MMFTLSGMQREHREWAGHNFPGSQPANILLGVFEEVGELAHAQLKSTQGIRGSEEEHMGEMIDAVGDIVVYLVHFCNLHGIDIEHAVVSTWDKVKERDWIKNPKNGLTE